MLLVACAEREAPPTKATPIQLVLENPGFEMEWSNPIIPGWYTAQHAGEPSYDLAMDDVVAATGKQSFRITQTQPQSYGMVEQHVVAPPELIGKMVRLSAKMKTSDVGPDGWTLFMFVVDGADYVLTSYTSPPLLGNTEWQHIEITGKVLPNTTKLKVGAYITDTGNGGVAWLDDVALQVIEDAPPATP